MRHAKVIITEIEKLYKERFLGVRLNSAGVTLLLRPEATTRSETVDRAFLQATEFVDKLKVPRGPVGDQVFKLMEELEEVLGYKTA